MAQARFDGQTTLITGAGSGIGAATARRYAADGGHPILLELNGDAVSALAKEIGGTAVVGDATDADLLAEAVGKASELNGGLDGLVTAAGFAVPGGAETIEMDVWRKMLAVNLDGALLAVRAALPAMRAKPGGSIVLISSIGGILGSPGQVSYATAKAGLLAMNRSVAIDHGSENIRCNAICPDLTESAMTQTAFGMLAEMIGMPFDRLKADMARLVPQRRWAKPEEIASVVTFLRSPDASFMTGSVVTADGGASTVGAASSNILIPPLEVTA